MSDRSCAAAADSDAVADDNAAADAGVLTASPGDSRPCWATLSCFLLRRTSLVRGGAGMARTMSINQHGICFRVNSNMIFVPLLHSC